MRSNLRTPQEIASALEADVDMYVEALAAVSGGAHAIIDQLEANPEQLKAAWDYGLVTRRLAQTARESMASLSEMVRSMEENAKLARVLREPTSRLVQIFDRLATATAVADDWDRRLQSLGVPVPPEEWEPEQEAPESADENAT